MANFHPQLDLLTEHAAGNLPLLTGLLTPTRRWLFGFVSGLILMLCHTLLRSYARGTAVSAVL